MKQLENIPWWICDEGDKNYVAYCDTDSVYVNAEPLLKSLYPNFGELSDKEKDDLCEKEALKYQNTITEYYDTLAKECFNVQEHRLEMKTEAVIRSAYFRATRRYAQWITKKEGVEKEELDIKGLEFMKVNFPPVFGEMFNDVLQKVLKGVPQNIIDQEILDFKSALVKNAQIPIKDLGNPTAVKTLNSYIKEKPSPGTIFSSFKDKAPAAVKAAVRYNDLMKFWKLDREHSLIAQGDKVKWVYLKNNGYKIDTIAFLDFDMPDKIKQFIEEYVDREKIFDSILLNKLENFYNDLGWTLNLNPYVNQFFSFE